MRECVDSRPARRGWPEGMRGNHGQGQNPRLRQAGEGLGEGSHRQGRSATPSSRPRARPRRPPARSRTPWAVSRTRCVASKPHAFGPLDPWAAFSAQTRFILDCHAVVALRMLRIAGGGEVARTRVGADGDGKDDDFCRRAVRGGGCPAGAWMARRRGSGRTTLSPGGVRQPAALVGNVVAPSYPAARSPPAFAAAPASTKAGTAFSTIASDAVSEMRK